MGLPEPRRLRCREDKRTTPVGSALSRAGSAGRTKPPTGTATRGLIERTGSTARASRVRALPRHVVARRTQGLRGHGHRRGGHRKKSAGKRPRPGRESGAPWVLAPRTAPPSDAGPKHDACCVGRDTRVCGRMRRDRRVVAAQKMVDRRRNRLHHPKTSRPGDRGRRGRRGPRRASRRRSSRSPGRNGRRGKSRRAWWEWPGVVAAQAAFERLRATRLDRLRVRAGGPAARRSDRAVGRWREVPRWARRGPSSPGFRSDPEASRPLNPTVPRRCRRPVRGYQHHHAGDGAPLPAGPIGSIGSWTRSERRRSEPIATVPRVLFAVPAVLFSVNLVAFARSRIAARLRPAAVLRSE